MSAVKLLLQLQNLDTERLRLEKQLEGLPQAAQIMECRAKRKELKAKQDQVVELSDEVEKKLSSFQQEEESIIKKLNDLQATLDSTHDYRVTQSVTRDMEGLMKRQKTLVAESDALLERQIKVDKLHSQVRSMLHNLDHKEEELTEQFKKEGGQIKAKAETLEASRKEAMAQLDSTLRSKYEKLRAEKKGIGIARLEGTTCSACHFEILEGNLRRLLAGPAVGECPSCHRLMVVHEEE